MVPRSIVRVALPYFLVSRPGSSRPRTNSFQTPGSALRVPAAKSFPCVNTNYMVGPYVAVLVTFCQARNPKREITT